MRGLHIRSTTALNGFLDSSSSSSSGCVANAHWSSAQHSGRELQQTQRKSFRASSWTVGDSFSRSFNIEVYTIDSPLGSSFVTFIISEGLADDFIVCIIRKAQRNIPSAPWERQSNSNS